MTRHSAGSGTRHDTEVSLSVTRDEIIGHPTWHRVSDLGIVQFRHDYDPELLTAIAARAKQLKREKAHKRHLNLNYMRGAHRYIPEITELINWPGRRERASELAGVELEPYPLPVISAIITFQDADRDGSVTWHADGVPVTEMIPLEIENLVGGELEIYRGDYEEGIARQSRGGDPVPEDRILKISHKPGWGILGQLMRTAHRVAPIETGHRITLNLNWRSVSKPWIDDNTITYLAADNPELEWEEEYLQDVHEVHIPAYLDHQKAPLPHGSAR